jgi:PAS domain S-box-containing protein
LIGKSSFDLIVPEEREKAFAGMEEVLEKGYIEGREYHVIGKDGSKIPVEMSVAIMKDMNGKPIGFVGITRDITRRKHTREQILKQSAMLDAINKVFLETLMCETDEEVARTCLFVAEELTKSKFGFICEVNQAGRFNTIAISDSGWEACRILKTNAALTLNDLEIRGIRGRVVKDGRAMIFNDPASHPDWVGTPEGHPRITCFLGVPLKHASRTIGMIGLANKESGYSLADQQVAETLSIAFVEALNRKRAEMALKESEERFKKLADLLPQTVFEIDLEGNFLYANRHGFDSSGYTQDDLDKGLNALQLFTPEDRDRVLENIKRVLKGEKSGGNEYTVQRKDGSRFPVIVYSTPIIHGKKPVGLRGIIIDITKRKQTEENIKASLKEKEILLKEIHHRVKNNLQIICSLLDLQADFVEDEQALGIFNESKNRIRTMALVHEYLYQSQNLARIDFTEYIRNLASYLFRSYEVDPDAIQLRINVKDDISLSIDKAIPCGLILNELLSNSLKYAFPEGREGEITIDLRLKNDKHTLIVSDNGVGFPKDLDFRNTESLGLQLVVDLTEQIDGSIELRRNGGTKFLITFP